MGGDTAPVWGKRRRDKFVFVGWADCPEELARAVEPIRGKKNLVVFSPGVIEPGEDVRSGVLLSTSRYYDPMIDALNVIEGHDERRTFVWLNLLSLTLTLGAIGFLLAAVGAVVAFPLIMSAFGLKDVADAATWLIRWPLLLVLMIGALSVFYRFGPCRDAAPRWWVSPGAMIAALLWLAGSAALSFYLSNFADYNATYGSLGAAIGLMMWMWLSTIAVLLGAQFDSVIEGKMSAQA